MIFELYSGMRSQYSAEYAYAIKAGNLLGLGLGRKSLGEQRDVAGAAKSREVEELSTRVILQTSQVTAIIVYPPIIHKALPVAYRRLYLRISSLLIVPDTCCTVLGSSVWCLDIDSLLIRIIPSLCPSIFLSVAPVRLQ